MHPSIEQLLKVQDIDSQAIFLRESSRLRPRELDDDRRKVADAKGALDAMVASIKRVKMDANQREVDVKKSDGEIEKVKVALNQAKSNSEYTIYKEQIKRQEEVRGKLEEEVIGMLTQIDELEVKRKDQTQKLEALEKTLKKKEGELAELLKGMAAQLADLETRRAGMLAGVDPEHLKLYERVLARHNNFAIARVESQVCHGCYMSVTSQEVNLLLQGQLLQCKSCSRILYLP